MSADTTWTPLSTTSEAEELLDDPIDEADLDEVDDADQDVEDIVEATDGSAKQASRPKQISRAATRRIASKAVEVSKADGAVVAVAAQLLGTSEDVVDVTVAINHADRSVSRPVADLSSIVEADPMEAGIIAATLERSRLRAVWNLLAALGVHNGSALNEADAKAALRVAKAVIDISSDQRALLDDAVALLRRS